MSVSELFALLQHRVAVFEGLWEHALTAGTDDEPVLWSSVRGGDFRAWVDGQEARLWRYDETGRAVAPPMTALEVDAEAIPAPSVAVPRHTTDTKLDARVAVHGLLEVARALFLLSERPTVDHVFTWKQGPIPTPGSSCESLAVETQTAVTWGASVPKEIIEETGRKAMRLARCIEKKE